MELFSPQEIGYASKVTREEKYSDYAAFTEKFKAKKTTDDCYTPPEIYEVIKKWVSENVRNLDGAEIVRPFFPGGDYQNFAYPDNCVVLDNPPFSRIAEIRRFYFSRGINYFLFAPALTLFSGKDLDDSFIVCGANITYENKAKIPTSFVTNMFSDDTKIYVCGNLCKMIEREDRKRLEAPALAPVRKIVYPECVTSAARLQSISKAGVDLRIKRQSVFKITRLDFQKGGDSIFGGGFLLSKSATKAKAEAEAEAKAEAKAVYKLSMREMEIIEGLK